MVLAATMRLLDVVKLSGAYSEEQWAALHNDGPTTELGYRLAWARTVLRSCGFTDSSTRSIWHLTDKGKLASESDIYPAWKSYLADNANKRKKKAVVSSISPNSVSTEISETEIGLLADDAEDNWREQLLDALMAMDPGAFERLAQRLLREAGFVSTKVTGRSGDGGIDGLGVYRLSLVSFPIFFQCKRYSGSVGAGAVRDFRGAMQGRGDKGLLITTGTFTSEAIREANRDGAPPIDLIDGGRLCDLLKQFGLGVITKTRTVEDIEVQPEFFQTI